MPQISLLLVDDDAGVREVVAEGLKNLGFDVAAADNGEDALQLLHTRGGFDVIVSDVRMPGMSGFDLRQQVMLHFPTVHFILISGYFDVLPEPMAILRKPFRLAQLEEVIRSRYSMSQQQ